MFYFALLWLRLLTLPPEPASRAGAAMVGRPDLADELVSICRRESPGSDCAVTVGLHPPDKNPVAAMYRKAVEKGWLGTCPINTASGPHDRERFGVRGVHGLSAAYSLWHLGPCLAPSCSTSPSCPPSSPPGEPPTSAKPPTCARAPDKRDTACGSAPPSTTASAPTAAAETTHHGKTWKHSHWFQPPKHCRSGAMSS
jgi:hypothetical protein